MNRYIIERDIPAIGSADRAEAKSNGVLSTMQAEQKSIQWEQSYVAGDRRSTSRPSGAICHNPVCSAFT